MAVLHDLQLAAEMADELVLMHQGQLVARGCPEEVSTAKRVADVFGVRLVPTNLPRIRGS
jgi:iron complex transport system ATP-binding protein